MILMSINQVNIFLYNDLLLYLLTCEQQKTMNKFLMAAVIITAIIVILSYFGGDDNETGFQS
jgi:hypothetical protein